MSHTINEKDLEEIINTKHIDLATPKELLIGILSCLEPASKDCGCSVERKTSCTEHLNEMLTDFTPRPKTCDDKCSMFNHTEEECVCRDDPAGRAWCNIHADTPQEPSRLEEIRDEIEPEPSDVGIRNHDANYLLSLITDLQLESAKYHQQSDVFKAALDNLKLFFDVAVCECGEPLKDTDGADYVNEALND